MNNSLDTAADLAKQICAKAKDLTLEIPRAQSSNNEQLLEKSLDLLLLGQQLKTTLNNLAAHQALASSAATKPQGEQTPEERVINEISKLNKKLPRWARKKHQMNSIILSSFLRLCGRGNQTVTIAALKEEFMRSEEDGDRFIGSFRQMAAFGKQNNAKVFELSGDEIRIWGPAHDAVETFKAIYQREASNV